MTKQVLHKHVPFATSIWKSNILITPEQHQAIIDYIMRLREQDKIGAKMSNIGGWQSNSYNSNDIDDILSPLFEQVKFITANVVHDLRLDIEGYQPSIINYWYNINNKNNYNRPHIHPKSSLSGVVYLKMPKNNGGNIYFERDSDGALWTFPASEQNIPERTQVSMLAPHELEFVVFPSYLRHGVDPNQTDEDRISMAINIGLTNG
jgi:uncharacterized protein (TIGR02466 family)